MIRQANTGDISRISEILVFTKRVNYRRIFHNDRYSFGELQVLNVAQEFQNHPELLNEIWVYSDDFVKGIIRVREREIVQLYVDSFLQGVALVERCLISHWSIWGSSICRCWKRIRAPLFSMIGTLSDTMVFGNTRKELPNVYC